MLTVSTTASQHHAVTLTCTVLPPSNFCASSNVVTTMLSIDSSTMYAPAEPSAQASIVFGWLGSETGFIESLDLIKSEPATQGDVSHFIAASDIKKVVLAVFDFALSVTV